LQTTLNEIEEMGYPRLFITKTFLAFWLCFCCALLVQAGDLEDGRAAIGAGDYGTARRLLKPLADQGDPDAQNALGVLYAQGWGVERDYDEALRWFRKAADQGHAKAQANLGDLYKDGLGVEQDYAEAARLFRLPAEQGYAHAQTSLGYLYDEGLGVLRDYSEAVRWYRMAAEQGNAKGQALLGAMYASGHGVGQDYAEAIKWYRKAAVQGFSEAQYRLGAMYEQGEGVERDASEAAKWYRMAAEQNHPGATARVQALSGGEQAPAVPTLERVREGSSLDLARAYLAVDRMLKMLPLAEKGAQIVTEDGTIGPSNASLYSTAFSARRDVYSRVIEERSFKKLAGTYTASATSSCRAAESMWASGILEGEAGDATVIQDGFKLKLVQEFEPKDETNTLELTGVVVEFFVLLSDPWSPHFVFQGELADDNIELRPDIQSIRREPRPTWLPRLDWDALSECAITLQRR